MYKQSGFKLLAILILAVAIGAGGLIAYKYVNNNQSSDVDNVSNEDDSLAVKKLLEATPCEGASTTVGEVKVYKGFAAASITCNDGAFVVLKKENGNWVQKAGGQNCIQRLEGLTDDIRQKLITVQFPDSLPFCE